MTQVTELPAGPRGRPKGSLNSKPRARSAVQAVVLAQTNTPVGVRAKSEAILQKSLAFSRGDFSPTSSSVISLEHTANAAGFADVLASYSCNDHNALFPATAQEWQAIPPSSSRPSRPAVPAPQQDFLFELPTDRLEPTISAVDIDDPFHADWQYW